MNFLPPPYLSFCNIFFLNFVLVCSLFGVTHSAFAKEPIQFTYLKEVVQEKQLALNAVVKFELPPSIISALDHDIHIQFKTEIVLLEAQDFLGITFKRARQSIEYHTELYAYGMNRYYVLYNHRNRKRQTFQTLDAALQTLGTLHAIPVINLSELDAEKTYFFQIRIQLDKWKLPAPLLIDALLEEYWHLNSGWQEIEIKHQSIGVKR